ncbi:hypothetical protein JCM8097_004332 [Rhodosporidiobolus ruineniae]
MSWSSVGVISAAASASSSALTAQPSPVLPNITGTATYNVSAEASNSTNEVVYLGAWRSDLDPGFYQAYSNASDAVVQFSWTGVAAAYVATRRPDRGICQITLDGLKTWSLDLYARDTNRTEEILFVTGTLAHSSHVLTVSQYAPDGRLGYYPTDWRFTAAYTRTQTATMPAQTYYSSYNPGLTDGDIAGAVVGTVIAVALIVIGIVFWRRRRRQRRNAGSAAEKLKKADEDKLPIPDDTSSADHAHAGAVDEAYHPGAGWPYGDPYAAYRAAAFGYPGGHPPPAHPDPSAYSSAAAPQPAWAPLSQRSLVSPLSPPSSDAHGPRYLSGGMSQVAPASSPGLMDSAYHSGGASDRTPAYPHHITGSGSDSRSYAVPEL